MTISFTCPSCEHSLKVKDELAGRKVKCPGCGGGVLVPSEEEEEAEKPAAAKARPSRPARAADDDEDRPRKKKKKKKKGNKGLLIGLGIGVAVLVAVILIIIFTRPRAQPPREPDREVAKQEPPKMQPPPAPPPQPPAEQRVAGLANRGEDSAVMNDMRQIGIFYNQYLITNPKGPRDSKAFANEIRRDAPHIAQALEKQVYYLLPGVRRNANEVVAYDVPGNTANQHIVLMGDGSVQTMGRQELQKFLPPAGK